MSTTSKPAATEGGEDTGPRRKIDSAPWPVIVLSILGLIYMGLITLGFIGTDRRLGVVEAVLAGAILLANSGLLQRIGSVKVSAEGFEVQIEKLEVRQDLQARQIRALHFLLRNFISEHELWHLWGLKKGKLPYESVSPFFKAELRHLRSLGFIEQIRTDVRISELPAPDDLTNYFIITDAGRRYLEFVEEFDKLTR